MRESLVSTDRRCIFREVFTPQSISRNGGEVTGSIAFSGGEAVFEEGVSGYIQYPRQIPTSGWCSVRLRTTLTIHMLTEGGYGHFVTVSWDSSSSAIRLFLDGEEHALTTAAMLAGSANQALLGARHTGSQFFKGTIAFAKGYSSQSSLEDHQDRLSKIAHQPSLIADGRNGRADEVVKTAGEKVIF